MSRPTFPYPTIYIKKITPACAAKWIIREEIPQRVFKSEAITNFMFLAGVYLSYEKHMLEQRYLDRLEELAMSNVPLSGIRIVERPIGIFPESFPKWVTRYLLPFHVAIEFPSSVHGPAREVGLGPVESAESRKDKAITHWRVHAGSAYSQVDHAFAKSYPIEAWPKFFKFFGYWPTCVNEVVLRNIVRTPKEGGSRHGLFLSPMRMPKSWLPRPNNCQTKALAAVHDATTQFGP